MKRASERGGSTRLAELAGSIVTVLAVGAASSALAQTAIQQSPNPTATPAPAKPKPAPKKPDPDDELVIRATRSAYQALPGAVVGDIEPELELSPADVQSYGVSTVTDLLDELAPQTRSDRGRGGESPVILLNGRRISGFNEIRDIPVEAILRVDILPEEVSLKYGYTADQRVVNIVLRPRFRALTGEATGGGDTEGGQESGQAEADLFRVRGDNRMNFDLKYQGSSDLTDSARGIIEPSPPAPYAIGGNVVSVTPGAQIDPAFSALFGAPVTVAGVPTVAKLRALALTDFLTTAGTANTTNVGDDRTLSPATQSISANGVVSRTLPFGLSGTLNATFGATSSQSLQGLPTLGLTVPAGDPFTPFGSNVQIDRYITAFGPLRQNVTGWTAHLGGTLNRDVGSWRLSLTGAYDHADSLTETSGGVNAAPLQALLTGLSPTFNPFAPLSASLLVQSAASKGRSLSDSGNVQILANGPLLPTPAGPLYASLKVGDTESASFSDTERFGLTQALDLARNDFNAQGNFDLPIASRRHNFLPWFGELSLNGNVAVDRLSDFGLLQTLGYGVNWTPITGVNLIVSHTQDHLAPTVLQLDGPTVLTPGVNLLDFATGQTVDVTQISGGNPALKSDRRNVFKVGLTLKPISTQNLSITASYIDSHIDDPISTFPAASAQIEAAFADRFIRDDEGELEEVDDRPVNFAWQERREIRWGVNFTHPIGPQPPPAGLRRRIGANGQGGPGGRPAGAAPRGAGGGATGAAAAGTDGAPAPDGGGASTANSAGVGSAAPAGRAAIGAGGGGGGGGGRGFGGRGFGGGAAPTGGQFQVAVYHTIYFADQTLVTSGGPLLDFLHGAAAGTSGGQAQQQVEAQLGYTRGGWGARASANWLSGTTVLAGPLSPTGTLSFSDITTVNLRLFANLGQMRNLVRRQRWLTGVRVTLSATNLFDQRVQVHDATGQTPLSYQPAYLNPAGRTVSLSVRKLFF